MGDDDEIPEQSITERIQRLLATRKASIWRIHTQVRKLSQTKSVLTEFFEDV